MAATLAGAAVWYCERGHLVFPLRPGTKIPATPHGFLDASMNPDTIRAWWTRWPDANIGLSTGHLFDVIDIDPPNGLDTITEIEEAGQLPTLIGVASTPRGWHMYIHPTGDGCTTAIRPGIDYRGRGGYIVAPPSTCDEGQWRWIEPLNLT